MATREQGRRRTTAVTVGLAAASLAGTLAVAATAYAEKAGTNTDSGTGGTGGTTTDDGPTTVPTGTWQPPAGGVSGPDAGSTDDGDDGGNRGGSVHGNSGGSS